MRKVLILLASQSDLIITEKGREIFRDFKVPFELRIASAHCSLRFVEELLRNFEVTDGYFILCVAGISAHLACVVASLTHLPVLAIPVAGGAAAGLDALLSMSHMPEGLPVATMPLGETGFTNAALFAMQTLALSDEHLSKELQRYRKVREEAVRESDAAHKVIFQG